MKVSFHCKDLLLAKHYQQRFGAQFDEMLPLYLQMDEGEKAGLAACWRLTMLREARAQEHYDYYTDHGDQRFVKYEADGVTPTLLVPQIVIVNG